MIKIKKGYKLCAVGADHVVIAPSHEYVNLARVVTLNESAAALWHAVEGEAFDVDRLTELLTATYNVGIEQARADAKAFISTLLDEHIAETTFA